MFALSEHPFLWLINYKLNPKIYLLITYKIN